MYKALRAYNCIRVKGECARPRAHMTAKRDKTLRVMETLFDICEAMDCLSIHSCKSHLWFYSLK